MKKLFKLFSLVGVLCVASAAQAKPVLNLKHWQTAQGTQVYFVRAPEIPMLDIKVAFAAGSARDGKYPGLAALTSAMFSQGSAGMNADQIAERFDDLGAQFGMQTARDMAVISLRTLTAPGILDPALKLFNQVIAKPNFSKTAFNRKRARQIAAIEDDAQSPRRIAEDAFYKAVYQQHPYAHPIYGNTKSVKALSVKQAKRFFNRYYVARNATVALVGAIDETQAKTIAENLSRALKAGEAASTLPKSPKLTAAVRKDIPYPASQTNVRIGQVGIARHDPHYFPLVVGNYILGGGMVSRLFDEVREKRGLSYGVSSQFVPMAAQGPFVIRLGTRTQQANSALDVASKTLKTFRAQGPTKTELNAAKQYLTGSFPLRFVSNKRIAMNLLVLGFYGLPDDFFDNYINQVNTVTAQNVRDAFQQIIQPDKMVVISVGQKQPS